MVKFSKELEAQLIPEWREAFVNYWQLKKQIKKIKISMVPKQVQDVNPDFGLSILDPIRNIAKKLVSYKFFESREKTEIVQVYKAKTNSVFIHAYIYIMLVFL